MKRAWPNTAHNTLVHLKWYVRNTITELPASVFNSSPEVTKSCPGLRRAQVSIPWFNTDPDRDKDIMLRVRGVGRCGKVKPGMQRCKDEKQGKRQRERGRKQKKVKAVGSKMQTVFRTLKWNN